MRVLGAGLICVFSPLNVRLPRHPEDFSDSTNDPWCRQGTLETVTVHHQINFATETYVERPGDSSPPDGVYWPGSCQFWFFWRRGKSFTIRSQSNTTHLLQIMGTRVRISSMRLLSLSLRIFSALLRNSREELYFGGSSGNFGFLTFFVVISDLEDILK